MTSGKDYYQSVYFLAGRAWLLNTLLLRLDQAESLKSSTAGFVLDGEDIGEQVFRILPYLGQLGPNQDPVELTRKIVERLIERGATPIKDEEELPTMPSLGQINNMAWPLQDRLSIMIVGRTASDVPVPFSAEWLFYEANRQFGARGEDVIARAYEILTTE